MSERRNTIIWLTCLCALLGCSEPAEIGPAGGASGMRFLGSDAESTAFARATETRSFTFPRDHGAHEAYRTEWWYLTGNLEAESGRHFGFELTFFRYALAPTLGERASAWATQQVWLAHLALTDTQQRRFDTAERMSRAAIELAGARADRFAVWVDDWSAEQASDGAPIRVAASTNEFGIELRLEPRKDIVLQGDGGLDAKGPEPGNASYYYSWPRLAVSGRVQPVDEPALEVTGLAWLDREWGTSTLSPGVVGWDWFALQLSDERDLMYYRLRTTDGAATPASGGSIVAADGRSLRLSAGDVELEPRAWWTSPATGVRYPVAWRLRAPAHGLDLAVEPVLTNQEVNLSVRYWEGAVRVTSLDPATPISGRGYLELAGYERD